MSPSAFLAAGGGVAAGLIFGLPVPAIVVLGALGWSARVAPAVLRTGQRRRSERIDPFGLQEPWRLHIQAALANRAKVRERADSTPSGPLRDRLHEIAERVDLAVDEAWQIAKRGQTLSRARRAIETEPIDQQMRSLEKSLAETPDEPRLAEALEARRAQRAAADRMDEIIDDTDTQLRLLDARMGEVVVRAAELSAHIGGAAVIATLSSDVDGLLTEMEALRRALDETHGISAGGLPTGEPE